MKNYIMIIAFCTINMTNGMEKSMVKHEPREWNAKDYDNSKVQFTIFLSLLQENNIQTKGKKILSVGCGTGNIEKVLAEEAIVHGFDASKNMIEHAQKKFGHVTNLSFEHCFAEDFKSNKLYNLAIASFSLHWIEDKKLALQRINNSLEINGELFTTLPTSNNPTPVNLLVAMEMMPYFQEKIANATGKNLPDLDSNTMQSIIGSSYPSHEEIITMLHETGFEIIKSEEDFYACKMSEEELRLLQWPIFSSRPFSKPLSDDLKKEIFEEFISRLMEKMPKTNDNKFLGREFTTVIHARKK